MVGRGYFEVLGGRESGGVDVGFFCAGFDLDDELGELVLISWSLCLVRSVFVSGFSFFTGKMGFFVLSFFF